MRPDRAVVAVSLRLALRSLRWVAPAVLLLLWVGLVLANPGPARSDAVACFPLFEAVTCWLAVLVGNVDDDGHRDLCTALVGSPGRLLLDRAVAVVAVMAAVAVLATAAVAGLSRPTGAGPGDVAAVLGVLLAGTLVGAAVGALLHRPLVRRIGVSVVLAALALLAATAAPPVTRQLRDVDGGGAAGVIALLVGAAVLAVASAAAGTQLARRTAR